MLQVHSPDWRPTNFRNCTLWLRGDSVTLVGGDVSVWLDKSGNGNDVSAGVGVRPLLVPSAAAYKGKPVLDFDGIDDVLAGGLATALLPAIGTWFVVWDADAIDTNTTIYNNDALLADTGTGNCGIALTSTPQVRPWRFDGSSARLAVQNAALTTPSVLSVTCSGDNGFIKSWANGKTPASTALVGTAQVGSGALRIGSNYSGAAFFDGRIAEVIAYNRVLSDIERMKAEFELLSYYGI